WRSVDHPCTVKVGITGALRASSTVYTKGFRMGVANLMTRRTRMLLLATALTGLAVAAAVATPQIGAEGKFETLKNLQTERRSFAKAITPAVVAVASSKPDIGNTGQTGLAAG